MDPYLSGLFILLLALIGVVTYLGIRLNQDLQQVTSGSAGGTVAPSDDILNSTSTWTYYDIYPKCCPGEPNYNSSYPTTECIKDNGCAHPGQLSALGYRPISFVQTHDLIAFYDNSDPNGYNFYTKYANKNINITGTCGPITKSFTALIADTCSNSDCSNCCANNSDPKTGYLIDMDYYTVIRHFGSTNCAEGTLKFVVDLSQPPVMVYCGANVGGCSSLYCCGANGVCGAGADYCQTGCQTEYGNCASTPNTCGPDGNVCQYGACCSQFGYCGNTSAFCGEGCLAGFGRCGSESPVILPTFAPTLLTTFAPTVSTTSAPTVSTAPTVSSTFAPTTSTTSYTTTSPSHSTNSFRSST